MVAFAEERSKSQPIYSGSFGFAFSVFARANTEVRKGRNGHPAPGARATVGVATRRRNVTVLRPRGLGRAVDGSFCSALHATSKARRNNRVVTVVDTMTPN